MEWIKFLNIVKFWIGLNPHKKLAAIQFGAIIGLTVIVLTSETRAINSKQKINQENEEEINKLKRELNRHIILCGNEKVEIARYYSLKIDTIYLENIEKVSKLNKVIDAKIIEINYYKSKYKQ